jgi:hypothetical protein
MDGAKEVRVEQQVGSEGVDLRSMKLGVVVPTCNLSNSGGRGRRIFEFKAKQRYGESTSKTKGLGAWVR